MRPSALPSEATGVVGLVRNRAWISKLCVAGALGLATWAAATWAAATMSPARADVYTDCEGKGVDADRRIVACKDIIDRKLYRSGFSEPFAFFHLGQAHLAKKQFALAVTALDAAIRLDPSGPTAHISYNTRAQAHDELASRDLAIADFSKAIELSPSGRDASIYYSNRCNAHYKLGNNDLVIADCSKAIELKPGYASDHARRGLAYAAKGQNDQALPDLRKALALEQRGAYREFLAKRIAELEKSLAVATSSNPTPGQQAGASRPTPPPSSAPSSGPAPAQAQRGPQSRRIALVVGTDKYDNLGSNAQLQRAVNDARSITKALTDLNFKVLAGENLSRARFNALWQSLLEQVSEGDTVAFYFSGHGVEIEGLNFLLPRDVPAIRFGRQEQLKRESISVSELLLDLRRRKPQASLLILDACRDHPLVPDEFRGSPIGRGGLARMDAPGGTFIMYAAGAGQTALDRLPNNDPDPVNSVYTRKLLPLLKQPGLRLPDLAQRIRREVYDLAATVPHQQTPAYYDGLLLTEPLCLAGC